MSIEGILGLYLIGIAVMLGIMWYVLFVEKRDLSPPKAACKTVTKRQDEVILQGIIVRIDDKNIQKLCALISALDEAYYILSVDPVDETTKPVIRQLMLALRELQDYVYSTEAVEGENK